MTPPNYTRTDLAIEEEQLATPQNGVIVRENTQNGIHFMRVEITNETGAKHLNRPIGHYITLSFAPVWDEHEALDNETLHSALVKNLSFLLHQSNKPTRILVVGLGNRAITADAVGPLTADKIHVTGHYAQEDSLRPYLPPCPAFAISPGVVGTTGIETQKLIQAAISSSKPSHVIVIDSLAARSTDRLGRCIQLSNSGISPGSGIGNHRAALNQETLGVPVIAIGTPLVVSSSTLVFDALEQAGITQISHALLSVLEHGKSYFVTLNDSDLATAKLSEIIANAINTCIDSIT